MSRIAVLVPTFRRPNMLARCLESIANQSILRNPNENVTVIVGDNNPDASATVQVLDLEKDFPCDLRSVHVPELGLCHNRNRLFAEALALQADLVVLIDDDEWAGPEWLCELVSAMYTTGAHALIGPVHTIFHAETPDWFRYSGIGQTNVRNAKLKTGSPSPKLASHNTIIRGDVLQGLPPPWFPTELNFLGAEDQAFFWRARAAGFDRILWCSEAVLHEEMPLERSDMTYFVSRSLQRGVSSVVAGNVTRKLFASKQVPLPILETAKGILKLFFGFPYVFLRRTRYRYARHAIYVVGRLNGHVGSYRKFYGK